MKTTGLEAVRSIEQNDEWSVQKSRCLSLETIAQAGDAAAVRLTDLTG